jgi:hypothetical protein
MNLTQLDEVYAFWFGNSPSYGTGERRLASEWPIPLRRVMASV